MDRDFFLLGTDRDIYSANSNTHEYGNGIYRHSFAERGYGGVLRMKDGAMMKCLAMVMIPATYVAYLIFSPNPADGVLFGSVVALVAALAGYDYAMRKAKGDV